MTDRDALLVPPGTRLLHIGPHKTGSTAVQVAFDQVRDRLADHGVHYAGLGRRPKRAGWSIGLPGKKHGVDRPPLLYWEKLVAEVEAAGDLRVCVSNEDFGRANAAQRRQIVQDLGGDRAHVVAVARRLDSYLPSQWQERVKAGVTMAWEDWLRLVLDRTAREYHFERMNVWRAHDVGSLIRHWTAQVDPERMTVIVSDDRDRTMLPRTFERLLGLPDGLLEPDAAQSNPSLSWAEVEVVRDTHEAFADAGFGRRQADPWTTAGLIRALQGAGLPRTQPATPPFPDWALDQIRELGEERAQAVRDSGVRVVGTPDSLLAPDDLEAGDATNAPALPPQAVRAAVRALVEATTAQLRAHVLGNEAERSPGADDPTD